MTEVHSAEMIPPIAMLNFAIPDDVQRDIAEAYTIGAEKHQSSIGVELDFSRSLEYYMGALRRHFAKIQAGVIYDEEDGQKHVAAMIIRLCQYGAKLNEQNDPTVEGYGEA